MKTIERGRRSETTLSEFDRQIVRDFVRAWQGEKRPRVRLSLLGGGLESVVARVDVERPELATHRPPVRFVVKKLDQRHEARTYEFLRDRKLAIAPTLLDVREVDDCWYLFIDYIRSGSDWPWRDLGWAARVAEQLAGLHEIEQVPTQVEWKEYEGALTESARETLEVVDWLSGPEFASVTVRRTSLRRLVARLPEVRTALFEDGPLPPSLIHGDAHPGNAMVCEAGEDAFLIDWGRTRLGSPFEDVSSWLQSLGLWEPRARQRHDRLLTCYLRARGLDEITPRVRDHYWLAAACNSLAGAMRYHLVMALEQPAGSAERREQIRVAARWMASVRRAEERWRALEARRREAPQA